MSTAAARLIDTFRNSAGRIKPRDQRTETEGHAIFRFDFGAFNASSNPEGIQSLTSTDTLVIGVVDANTNAGNPTGNYVTRGILKLESVKFYSSTTFALGTAANVSLKIVRAITPSATAPAEPIIKVITEASGFGTATVTGDIDIDLVLYSGDKLVIVPDAAIDTAAAATNNLWVEVSFERLQDGGRLSQGTAVA